MRSLQSDASFIDQGIAPSDHNIKARILRNGLVVSAFSLLETYLEDRLEEAVASLSSSAIPYSSFPDEFRNFFTVQAVQGLANRLKFLDKNDKLIYAEQNISSIARILSNPSSYNKFGFSPNGSNIKSEDVRDLPKLFGVKNGWFQLQTVCSEIGASRLALSNDFENFKKARNAGAHDIGSNIASLDLDTHIETALLVGISSDISISNAIEWLCRSHTHALAMQHISTNRPKYKFLVERGDGRWAEYGTGNARIIKIYPDFENAKRGAATRSRQQNTHLVAKDLSLRPVFLI